MYEEIQLKVRKFSRYFYHFFALFTCSKTLKLRFEILSKCFVEKVKKNQSLNRISFEYVSLSAHLRELVYVRVFDQLFAFLCINFVKISTVMKK